ncbi:hypothetical protein AXX17_AT1G29200 [Arabidopsis thaliana]|uniref:Uncharacterized protein n=1 Tax=Arabidopsis thaliana TaxID=3702 RepID=A0A178W8G9_ARATH|nr:hypothetical protein AXX17_AT1G29200 [Arabidopsis thaliana]
MFDEIPKPAFLAHIYVIESNCYVSCLENLIANEIQRQVGPKGYHFQLDTRAYA